MSFFNEFLNEIGIDNLENKIECNLIFDEGLRICSKIKIEVMQENEIILKCYRERIRIFGECLNIKTMSKGEIIVTGKVFGVTKI